MNIETSRLRAGEWLVTAAALLLGIVLFALPWYGFVPTIAHGLAELGKPTDATGWQSLEILRWLILIVVLGGLAVGWLQATRPAPAAPVCATVLECAASVVLFVALVVRVIDVPSVLLAGAGVNTIEAKIGAYIGLVLTAAIVTGAYVSMRQDGIAEGDAPARIETLRLTPRPAARGG